MATRTTISLPDDLASQVQAEEHLNVSGICQAALADELERRRIVAKLVDGMGRIELTIETEEGCVDVAFTGRLIAEDSRQGFYVYLTERQRIAVYDERRQQLHDFDDLDDAQLDEWLAASAAGALGEKRFVELDI